jgi:hypothetical protein
MLSKIKALPLLKKIFLIKISLPLILVLILVLPFPLYYFTARINPGLALRLINLEPTPSPQSDAEKYLPRIAKLISLPEETPQTAVISDIDKLGDQPFFKNARNGDIILIYPSSRKSILYRPSENKIIEVGTIQTATPTSAPATQSAVIQSPTP